MYFYMCVCWHVHICAHGGQKLMEVESSYESLYLPGEVRELPKRKSKNQYGLAEA